MSPPDPSIFDAVDPVIDAFKGEKYILGRSADACAMIMLGGFERGLYEYASSPEVIEAASRSAIARADALDEFYIRDGQDGICWGQDFAYNNGPFISPEMFRRFCLPNIKHRVERIRERFGMPILQHACGNNWKLMDMFVEAGYAAYQSIQASAGMDLGELKERYGRKLVLWGGFPVEILVEGTRDEIRRAVREAVEVGKPGGGYIFGTSHSVCVGTPYDNFMTMVDEFEKVRDY